MLFKMPSSIRTEDTLQQVCFDRKHLFDEVILKDSKDLRDNKDDNYDHNFIVADSRQEKDIMEFMKSNIKGFIKMSPEALFALKLDGGNFPLLIHHFSMLQMNILTDF